MSNMFNCKHMLWKCYPVTVLNDVVRRWDYKYLEMFPDVQLHIVIFKLLKIKDGVNILHVYAEYANHH